MTLDSSDEVRQRQESPLEALQEGERWWVPREKEREVN
jgi:hypothetical protein